MRSDDAVGRHLVSRSQGHRQRHSDRVPDDRGVADDDREPERFRHPDRDAHGDEDGHADAASDRDADEDADARDPDADDGSDDPSAASADDTSADRLQGRGVHDTVVALRLRAGHRTRRHLRRRSRSGVHVEGGLDRLLVDHDTL